MRYQIEFTSSAAKAFGKLTDDVRQRLADTIDALADDPRPPGVEKLRGSESAYRVRVGDYRILYVIVDRALIVTVIKVGHRRDVYR
jgi:mRNA interferase RelE/StbE